MIAGYKIIFNHTEINPLKVKPSFDCNDKITRMLPDYTEV